MRVVQRHNIPGGIFEAAGATIVEYEEEDCGIGPCEKVGDDQLLELGQFPGKQTYSECFTLSQKSKVENLLGDYQDIFSYARKKPTRFSTKLR